MASIIIVLLTVALTIVIPIGHTITKYDIEFAEKVCESRGGVYEYNTFGSNTVVCCDGNGFKVKSSLFYCDKQSHEGDVK